MAEEVSPESKVYVKEEIEKVRNEFKEDLKEARTKATKTFTTVAIVVGLVAGFGAYFSMESTIQQKLSEEGWTNLKKQAEDANDTIQKIKLNVQNTEPMLVKSYDQCAESNGYLFLGDISMTWATVDMSKEQETYYFGWDGFPQECFAVITSLAGEVEKKSKKEFTFKRSKGYEGTHEFTYLAIGH